MSDVSTHGEPEQRATGNRSSFSLAQELFHRNWNGESEKECMLRDKTTGIVVR